MDEENSWIFLNTSIHFFNDKLLLEFSLTQLFQCMQMHYCLKDENKKTSQKVKLPPVAGKKHIAIEDSLKKYMSALI